MNPISRKARAKIHNCQIAKIPAVATKPVTSSGVSAANWVAAMLRPALQPLRLRPARKYSSRLCEATLRERMPDETA